jgi:hypothetical protein
MDIAYQQHLARHFRKAFNCRLHGNLTEPDKFFVAWISNVIFKTPASSGSTWDGPVLPGC